MFRPRPRPEAFYARVLEEALGFLGSRLVNGRRACTSLRQWMVEYRVPTSEHTRQVAAFVLTHKAAERAGEVELPLPLRDLSLFDAVTHALGYTLGEALHRRLQKGAVRPDELGALFRDPLANPRARYWSLLERPRRAAGRPAA
jgi:hypothetical protein